MRTDFLFRGADADALLALYLSVYNDGQAATNLLDFVPGPAMTVIDGFDGQPTTRAALRLAPYVFVRPGELRQGERLHVVE